MRYILDTNAASEALRKPNGRIARKLHRLRPGQVCISAIVACELRYGLSKKPSEKLRNKIEPFLQAITVLDFPAAAATTYGILRADLQSRGQPISGNDMLIAAHAIHAKLILVTDNVMEFERVPGLKLENWLRE